MTAGPHLVAGERSDRDLEKVFAIGIETVVIIRNRPGRQFRLEISNFAWTAR
jgi:hypothetical protein